VCLVRILAVTVLISTFAPPVARAQERTSHWGVGVSVTPTWELHDRVKELLFDEEEEATIEGSEFTIGFVRGSTLGGDWGVSFVHKPWKDGSGTIETGQDCFNQAQTICRPSLTSTVTDDVVLNGVQVHWFIAFATIKERVQIGLNVAGGIGSISGNVIETRDFFIPTGFNQQGPTGFRQIHEVETFPAKDELLPYFPIGKVEAEGAVIVVPGLKIKVAGGLNFPAVSFRVGAVYLFGAQ
jgi:hypothetical protein